MGKRMKCLKKMLRKQNVKKTNKTCDFCWNPVERLSTLCGVSMVKYFFMISISDYQMTANNIKTKAYSLNQVLSFTKLKKIKKKKKSSYYIGQTQGSLM